MTALEVVEWNQSSKEISLIFWSQFPILRACFFFFTVEFRSTIESNQLWGIQSNSIHLLNQPGSVEAAPVGPVSAEAADVAGAANRPADRLRRHQVPISHRRKT